MDLTGRKPKEKDLAVVMIVKKYVTLAAWISVLVLIIFNFTRTNALDEKFFESFTSFDSHELLTENPLVYRVAYEGQELGYLTFGTAYGYQSDITIGVVMDDEGRVLETAFIDENETPSFINKINNAGFLEREFPGKAIADGFDTNTNINAVTGATVSSKAITKAVVEASQVVGRNYLDIQVPSNTQVNFGVTEVILLGMLALAFLSYKIKNKALRYLTMAYAIILLGFKYKQFIAYSWIVSIVTGKVPAFGDNVGWYILVLGTVLFIALTGKNIYCTYICPFGQLQQAEHKLAGFKFFKVNGGLTKRLRMVPALLAYVGFVVATIYGQLGALSFEPFSLIYGRTGGGIQWALLPIVLIMSLFVMGFYCNNACPVGFVLRSGTKLRRLMVRKFRKEKGKADLQGLTAMKGPKAMSKSQMTFKIADVIMLLAVIATAGISIVTIFGNI